VAQLLAGDRAVLDRAAAELHRGVGAAPERDEDRDRRHHVRVCEPPADAVEHGALPRDVSSPAVHQRPLTRTVKLFDFPAPNG
jgi:hypothetical protein